VDQIRYSWPRLADRFFQPPSVVLGTTSAQKDPWAFAWPSFRRFDRTLRRSRYWFRDMTTAMYDPEGWEETPPTERRDPGHYFQRFAARAHANGFEVIITPHQSLMSVPGGRCGADPGETETDAYIRCDIAGQAARFADVVETQAQGMQATPSDYRSFVVATALQARLANPSVRVISGLTANGASARQMYAAWDSVRDVVDGFYLAVGSNGRIPAVVRFLRMLPSS